MKNKKKNKKSYFLWGLRKGLLIKAFLEGFLVPMAKGFRKKSKRIKKKDLAWAGVSLILFLSVMIYEVRKGNGFMIFFSVFIVFIGVSYCYYYIYSHMNKYLRQKRMDEHFLIEARTAARTALDQTPFNKNALLWISRVIYKYDGEKYHECFDDEEERAHAGADAFMKVLKKHGIPFTSQKFLD